MQFYLVERVANAPYATFFTPAQGFQMGDAERCEKCGAYIGTYRWLPPYRASLEASHHDFGDFAFGPGNNFLISEKFRAGYFAAGLTGLEDFGPVEFVRFFSQRKVGPPPAYFRVWPQRGSTALDMAASGFEYRTPPKCHHCWMGLLKRWKRLVVDPNTWTGEDLFIPRGLNVIMATQRVKDLCDRLEITNAELIPAEDARYDFCPWESQANS